MDEIQQVRRRLDEQVLERAEADPQWRRQLLEDPQTAMGSIPEARQLEEMYESSLPTEELPPDAPIPPAAQEEYRHLSQSLTAKILDRAARDPLWKQRLIDEPDVALREGDFPELTRLDEIRQQKEEQMAEVRGHLGDLMSLGDTEVGGTAASRSYLRYCCHCYGSRYRTELA
jgi:hypothetical protein